MGKRLQSKIKFSFHKRENYEKQFCKIGFFPIRVDDKNISRKGNKRLFEERNSVRLENTSY